MFDTYSRRTKRISGEVADVYVYDQIPVTLRTQIVHIWSDSIDNGEQGQPEGLYGFICKTLRKEYGVFHLSNDASRGPRRELLQFFMHEPHVDKVLDVIELTFRGIDIVTRKYAWAHDSEFNKIPDDAIRELNIRFQQHGIGYRFENGVIIRVDNHFVHSEVIKPALNVLADPAFATAQAEFLACHQHYRSEEYSDAVLDACRAFESTMKIIGAARGWDLPDTPQAKHLVDSCFSHGLIPTYWRGHFDGLRQVLESAIPTARNRLASHGQGTKPVPVTVELAAYVINVTAATILFLYERHKATPRSQPSSTGEEH